MAPSSVPATLPHEVDPKTWPLPDYFDMALQLTAQKVGERASSLRLALSREPAVIVLPVQTQAFGWSPAMRALVGAQLDRELAARGVDASRQTDIADAHGPFVRRFSDQQLEALARAHPRSKLLGLYLGHDSRGTTFLTLVGGTGATAKLARRSVAQPASPSQALQTVGTALPAMLAELGFGAATARVSGAPVAASCSADTWALADPAPDAPASVRACHAIVLATLAPEFEPARLAPVPRTPSKLAWLAQAHVEADSLASQGGPFAAIRALAWAQLQLADGWPAIAPLVDSNDPVVRPLARLLWAPRRASTIPASSIRDAALRYMLADMEQLPPYARVLAGERLEIDDHFPRVDLCSIDREFPSVRALPGCAGGSPRPTRAATRAEALLYNEWRLASSYRDLIYYGHTLGLPERRKAALAEMPADLAAHPFIRQARFATESLDQERANFDELLKAVRSVVQDHIQSMTDLQQFLGLHTHDNLSESEWTRNLNLLHDDRVRRCTDDEARLLSVLRYDAFVASNRPASQRVSGTPVAFLKPQMLNQPSSATSPTAAQPTPSGAATVRSDKLFTPTNPSAAAEAAENQWRRVLAQRPDDMGTRTDLAMLMLGQGASMSDALALLEKHPVEARSDRQVRASNDWAAPAHAFFFAGELGAAKDYYERVRRVGTRSESDMHAEVRLRQIDGDIAGALRATEARLERYESDFSRRDLAGFEFMRGHAERAWSVLTPRLVSTKTLELWTGVQVGQRMEGKSLQAVSAWLSQRGVDRVQIQYQDVTALHLHRYATLDREPTEADIAVLQALTSRAPLWAVSAQLSRAAARGPVSAEELRSLQAAINQVDWQLREPLEPLYAWVAWRATAGADPALALMGQASLANNFDKLLAAFVVLAMKGDSAQAARYFRAARFALADIGLGTMTDTVHSRPYQLALLGYLVQRENGDKALRDEVLKHARAYQRVFAFLAWPYAMEANLAPEPATRMKAACRAQKLDPASMLLGWSGMKPSQASAACRQAGW
ncbi:MAG TPA: hypothetical protein VGQ91_12015 [Ideonella sp.]|nr:hypothetical protein [Ideonella sp.]